MVKGFSIFDAASSSLGSSASLGVVEPEADPGTILLSVLSLGLDSIGSSGDGLSWSGRYVASVLESEAPKSGESATSKATSATAAAASASSSSTSLVSPASARVEVAKGLEGSKVGVVAGSCGLELGSQGIAAAIKAEK